MEVDLAEVKKIHFIGIGGIGVSALAQLFKYEGKNISGTNDNDSPITLHRLTNSGVSISTDISVKNIDKDTDLIVYSDAWDTMYPEFITEVKTLNIPLLTNFEALGLITEDRFTIAVTGTHGKTTTSAMLAKILSDAELKPTAVIGSIVKDFDNNFLAGTREPLIVEACEYKEHVLRLLPNILVINNIELDHTDYFTDLEQVQDTFHSAAKRLSARGILVTNPSDANIAPILKDLKCTIVDFAMENVRKLELPGEHNVMNAKAAKATAKAYAPSLSDISIDTSLELFRGTWRRFEYIGETEKGALVYDDYAHHPTAVTKTIEAFRSKFSDRQLTVVFHPHLYSRTKSFFDGFAQALSFADNAIVAPIFAAREKPDSTISHKSLARNIHPKGGKALALDSFDEIVTHLLGNTDKSDLIVTMGAGDIYRIGEQLIRQK